jgi:predicted NAD/FAD-binding protein
MPFEALGHDFKKTVAVIGGGISGMSAAHMLADSYNVVLFEAEKRLGGHARTIVAGKNGDQPVDTGFIVFNYANYPLMADLFARLDVPVEKSDMSFGASVDGGRIEYGLSNLSAVFAQKANIVNGKYLRMLRDIFRFNAKALETAKANPDLTIGEFVKVMGLSEWFRDFYLLPLSGAIWSTPVEQIMEFPAYSMMQFFENHALLHHTGQHQWYTVSGGSTQYVQRLETRMKAQGVEIRLGSWVKGVSRVGGQVEVHIEGCEPEAFDEVVFATHSDDTLKMLTNPTSKEILALSEIAYQPNQITLHADEAVMPKRKAVWSSWNYSDAPGRLNGQIDLTYWMNKLQNIDPSDPLFVTLNSSRPIREELIYDQVTLRHPVYTQGVLRAQKEIAEFNGENNTWFCGAWMRHGFHEDGIYSAAEVANRLNAARIFEAAA